MKSDRTDHLDISSYIHQASLDPHTSIESLNTLCDASKFFNFGGFCTNLIRIPLARKRLGSKQKIKLIAVIGFPFGSVPNKIKRSEAEWAVEHGADELDLVPNFLALQEGNFEVFAEELSIICEVGLVTRVIIDAARLSEDKLSLAIEACIDAGARGIQTGTGFGPKIDTSMVLKLHSLIRGRCSLKAIGGINTISKMVDLLEAGASEIGTSYGPEIMKELRTFKE
ncbi:MULTISPECIES: deoxyribose-phosphate aldolase [Prochlorococcus]|uniref:deoxyribose-phosphate aldolase n=1 Tax=Prochlorococcus TaxID=1218 RepID=UPI0005338B83|nr:MULTISPECIES: deoxyribose-phosphate aldolase [Prochlorococcus]KGG13000.1 Deoxyribose-phosphate aldolase [Prochlorococcus sp. MIT 0601]